ncbi:unnamed protein product [Rotaria sordida]|uniref:Uncharacterized protein n=1 Tax=Rotaria sordida TaxID=392033 RepID=A0A819WBE1_9BILA|nr:unnamed protein product [Rotaria sordida]CAF4123201.1 unnamed protein product [Rotaria sordida]
MKVIDEFEKHYKSENTIWWYTRESCFYRMVNKTLRVQDFDMLFTLSFFISDIAEQIKNNLILRDLLTNQITHLNIDIKNTTENRFKIGPEIFPKILSLCKNLTVLNFCDMFSERNFVVSLTDFSWNHCIPSTLIKLRIQLSTLADCLHLLDGPFVCLSTLIITVTFTFHTTEYKNPTKIPKLKYFSLTALNRVEDYDDLIVPLLRRMINLEELKLYLSVDRSYSNYIDGIQLYDQFLIYMTQLKNFTFYIKTEISFMDDIKFELQSNEEIQHSFIGRGYPLVASYVNSNPFALDGACYIYSLPYDFEYFKVDNSFQGGAFHKVRQFISRQLTLITFPHLKFLDVKYAHVNYVARFLLKKSMHLPRLSNLSIEYELLMLITNHFTNDPTYFNFDKLKSLDVGQSFVRPKNFHQYFPLL